MQKCERCSFKYFKAHEHRIKPKQQTPAMHNPRPTGEIFKLGLSPIKIQLLEQFLPTTMTQMIAVSYYQILNKASAQVTPLGRENLSLRNLSHQLKHNPLIPYENHNLAPQPCARSHGCATQRRFFFFKYGLAHIEVTSFHNLVQPYLQPHSQPCGNSGNIIRSLTGTVSAGIAQWKIQGEIKSWKSLQVRFQSHRSIPNLQCSAIGTVPKHDPREYQLITYLIRLVGRLTMEYCMNIALSHVSDEAVVLVAKTHLSLLDAMKC